MKVANFNFDYTNQDYYPFGMLAVGRNWDAGSSEGYRFGFNGKEGDSETNGEKNIYNYGFRIYNSRLGKFLSVDPLMKSYPMFSPYQFSGNRPIDGIDLDGLEYLGADEALIESRNGIVLIKIENYSSVYQFRFKQVNENPMMWDEGSIGVNTTLFSFGTETYNLSNTYNPEVSFKQFPSLGFANEDSNPNANILIVESPKTAQSNNTVNDNRYSQKAIYGVAPAGGKIAVGFTLAIDVTAFGLSKYADQLIINDINERNEQITDVLPYAINDLNMGILQGYVPIEYQNPEDLSAILNVILQGENTSDNPALYDIGIEIVKNISNNYREDWMNYEMKFTGVSGAGLDGFTGNQTIIYEEEE